MGKGGNKKENLPEVSIIVGRCWRKKYERMYKILEYHVRETYNSKVNIESRIKRNTPFVRVRYCYQDKVLDLFGYSFIQDYIDRAKIFVYFVALALYILSTVITVTNVFVVFVDGKVVYNKTNKQTLASETDIVAALDYYMKEHIANYSSYLKK